MSAARNMFIAAVLATAAIGTAFAWEMPWRQYPGQDNIELPKDYKQKTEWQFARLMYPPYPGLIHDRGPAGGGRIDWRTGRSSWNTGYDAADRHVAQALRRLTRIQVRSVEQPVNLDDGDDVFNYPWLYAAAVGHWQLTDRQAKQLREYLDRGGFFLCDNFHGTEEWAVFKASMQRVYPDRPIVDIPDTDPIFRVVYDLSKRFQIPGDEYLRTGRTYEYDGVDPHWRGIYDAKGRLVVAICHNMDLGDAWEYADDPQYLEKFSTLAFQVISNYVAYSMTH